MQVLQVPVLVVAGVMVMQIPLSRCWALWMVTDGRGERGWRVCSRAEALGEFCNMGSAIWTARVGGKTRWSSKITDRQESLPQFSTTKLSRESFEFLSAASDGMIVSYRRDLVYVYFKLKEEETGTGRFLLNTSAVKFCWFFASWGMCLFIKKRSLFCHCVLCTMNWSCLWKGFLASHSWQILIQSCTSITVNPLIANPGLPPL